MSKPDFSNMYVQLVVAQIEAIRILEEAQKKAGIIYAEIKREERKCKCREEELECEKT